MVRRNTIIELLSLAVTSAVLVRAQYGPYGEDTGSFPHVYPGMPSGDFSPEWQNCTSPTST